MVRLRLPPRGGLAVHKTCTDDTDKQGFPMKQGVLLQQRTRLLLADGHSCYRARRDGERKRKSVRGCIVGNDIRVLSCIIVKQGDNEMPGLTDNVLPKRLGPKRGKLSLSFPSPHPISFHPAIQGAYNILINSYQDPPLLQPRQEGRRPILRHCA